MNESGFGAPGGRKSIWISEWPTMSPYKPAAATKAFRCYSQPKTQRQQDMPFTPGKTESATTKHKKH